MLGKLMKYEFKSMGRIFLPIYVTLIIIAVVNRVFRIGNLEVGFAISAFILVLLFMGLGCVTIIEIIQRFNKNLLKDEGYLMFTLPVTSTQLIMSKLLISLVWTILSGFVAVCVGLIIVGDSEMISVFLTDFSRMYTALDRSVMNACQISAMHFMITMIVIGLLIYTMLVFQVYFSLAAAQLPVFVKYRWIAAFVVYNILNTINPIGAVLLGIFIPIEFFNSYSNVMSLMIVGLSIVCLVLFIGTKYILDKHLNLE